MRAQWIPLILVVAAGCSSTTGSGVVLQTPTDLSSVSLDGAIALTWSDNAYTANPNDFANYRVYSTSYNRSQNQCGTSWSLEGTTVAPEFVAGAMKNGVPRCFAVSAISKDGTETARSGSQADTPRPDSRNVVLYAWQVDPSRSGFRFWGDANNDGIVQSNELGVVGPGSLSTNDFRLEKTVGGTLVLQPVWTGTGVEFYDSSAPVEDLTSIDFAPDQTYRTSAIDAIPGYGYVFRMDDGQGFIQYGAVRVTHVGTSLIIFDWAYQTDPTNPELRVGRR